MTDSTESVQLQYRNPDFFDDIVFTISVQKLVPFSGILAEGEPVLESVVASVQAVYKAVYSDGENTFSAVHNCEPGLPYPASADGFTDYSSLTEAQIIQWLEQQPSYAFYQNSLALTIEEMVTKEAEPGLPWATQTA